MKRLLLSQPKLFKKIAFCTSVNSDFFFFFTNGLLLWNRFMVRMSHTELVVDLEVLNWYLG